MRISVRIQPHPPDSGKFREYLIIKITPFYSMQVSKYVLVSVLGALPVL
jgi:hypothetical protein